MGARPRTDPPGENTKTLGVSGARPLAARVHVVGKSKAMVLRSGECIIGTAPDCDLVVDDSAVSRRHLRLTLVPEGVRVVDVGSRNGTFYLGKRIGDIVLSLGSIIEIGTSAIGIDADQDSLTFPIPMHGPEYGLLVGPSFAMRRVFSAMARLEGSLAAVLVEGESGVGKELVAAAIHEHSSVSGGPFVAMNCGALPRELVASELFGHKRGAFSGAHTARKGAFETADGGTLFLDEVGELPLDLQPMLLRALESGEVRPVGSDQTRTVAVRLISATNRKLEAMVAQGLFREDLYYRLCVVRLFIPPLRERPEDIEPLAQRFAHSTGRGALPEAVVEALRGRWLRGNARELRNIVQSYVALGALPPDSPPPVTENLDLALRQAVHLSRSYAELKEEIVDRFTAQYLDVLLEHTDGNQSTAAKIAGLDRTYLGRLITKRRSRN